MVCVGSHHGGYAKGLMVSIPYEYCGKFLARYSRVVIRTLLVDNLALLIVDEIGFMGGAVCIIYKLKVRRLKFEDMQVLR